MCDFLLTTCRTSRVNVVASYFFTRKRSTKQKLCRGACHFLACSSLTNFIHVFLTPNSSETSVMTAIYRTYGTPTLRVETSDISELSLTTYACNLWYAKTEGADIEFLRNVFNHLRICNTRYANPERRSRFLRNVSNYLVYM